MKHQLLKLSPKKFCAATKACDEGFKFAARFKSMSAVWKACPRVDWLIWILNAIRAERDEKAERLFAVWCARNTPMADGRVTGDLLTDPRSHAALEVAERFAKGKATADELAAAGAAARAAAGDAARAAAGDAAGAAAWAAAGAAAWAAARAAARAAAGDAAGAAAWAAAWAAARAAAGDAAGEAQSAEFRRVIKNPFLS